MAKIRLKKGQTDPSNPHATSVVGPAKPNMVNVSDVEIESSLEGSQPLTEENISVEDWESKYKPIANHLDENASWQDENGVGVMFETYGEEYDFVASQPEEKVWTYVDGDNGTYLVPGLNFVNRIGYFVTEEAWPHSEVIVTVEEWDTCSACDGSGETEDGEPCESCDSRGTIEK